MTNFSTYIIRQKAKIRARHFGETFLYTRHGVPDPIVLDGDIGREQGKGKGSVYFDGAHIRRATA